VDALKNGGDKPGETSGPPGAYPGTTKTRGVFMPPQICVDAAGAAHMWAQPVRTFLKLVKQGIAPQPLPLHGVRKKVWLARDVQQAIESLKPRKNTAAPTTETDLLEYIQRV
jgi:predicted DNA-binding transcriptional regulator AlpA